MRRLLTVCIAVAVVCAAPNFASAALWEILDTGLQDTTNFVNQGGGTLGSRSDIAGNPGTRYNVTLSGSGWQDMQIGDGFDLPTNNAGIAAATGNSGNLSAYAGYTMTIKNPNSSGWFMATIYMNTGWTDPGFGETDRYYQDASSWTWVGPGQTVTLTLDFQNAAYWNGSAWVTGQTVQNLNHVTNIGLKIGSDMGSGDYKMPSGTAFDVDVVSRSGLWEIQDAGLQDATNFVKQGGGTVTRSDITSDPGTRYTVTLTGSGWLDTAIGDGFDLPTDNAGIVAATGNGGDLSSYRGYTMTIKNPNTSGGFMVALYMNTGWTDSPWGETDRYYQDTSGWTWVIPGQTVTLTLDFENAAYWNGSAWVENQTVQKLNHVGNIGLKIGTNIGSGGGDYEMPSGTPFNVDVVSNVLELNAQTLYVQTGQNVVVDMDVVHLLQRVNACQAMLGYDSTYFPNPSGAVVGAGGGVWDLVIYDSWSTGGGTPGQIDTAIGVNAYGATGTNADGTVAVVTLAAGTTEGTTQLVFRPDASPDPGLTASTFLSDMSANPIWPMKYATRNIVIDGTAPTINIASAKQGGQELIGTSVNAVQGTVDIQVTASDTLAGLAGPPTVTVKDSSSTSLPVTFVNESPTGTFNYQVTIGATTANGTATIDATVSDKAGNTANAAQKTFNVNKNQITGTVEMATLSSTSYGFSRNVVFTATDSGGSVLKSWTVSVGFNNNTTTQVAAGTYTLTDVPGTIAGLSAKTAWSLRRKQAVSLGVNGQATVDFTVSGGTDLLGGDINGSNSINILDYSVLKVNWFTTNAVADINGDGSVNTSDYLLMKGNWFTMGDAP